MYKDDIWYRKLEAAVEERRDALTAKQWTRYRIDYLLRVADRVREFSDSCEVCQDYQHTLTRLEEELQELPNSKAQRQYQEGQLRRMGEHFVATHHLAPPGFFLRRWLRTGVFAGLGAGLVSAIVTGRPLFVPLGTLVLAGVGVLYGLMQDQKFQRNRWLI
jgi:hypothetical protein